MQPKLGIWKRFTRSLLGVDRDLTGPEKVRLFESIDIPTLFPAHPRKHELKELWSEFFHLINKLKKPDCDPEELEESARAWVRLFISLYQTKDVTPYIHAFAMHVPQFIRLHGNITMFTQQGLEKLNDLSTKYFQRGSNHREDEALRQMLERMKPLKMLDIAEKKDLKSVASVVVWATFLSC